MVSKIQVNNLKESVLESVNQIGGFNSFLKENETILLKPNFNTADPFPASTDRIGIDIEGIKVIQTFPGNDLEEINPEEMIQIKVAREFGI